MRAVRVLLALLVRVADACDRAASWLAAAAGLVAHVDPRDLAHATAHATAHCTGRPSLRVVGGAS